jgi:SpoIID/LytB domain protein
MSQYGAKGMAEAGFNFVQILEHYYTDTKVK